MKRAELNTLEIWSARLVISTVWVLTGLVSLGGFPLSASLDLLARVGLQGPISEATLYAAALLDIVLGVLTITRPSKRLWKAQAVLILIYTVIISVRLPEFWLHPFGPVLKNLPIFMILWLLHRHQGTQP